MGGTRRYYHHVNLTGTAIDGDTLRYPIGNKQAVDYYVAHFRGIFNCLTKGFYGIRHTLVSDSASTVPLPSPVNSLYPSQEPLPQEKLVAGHWVKIPQLGPTVPITIKPS
jgi:hypothetical protein